VPSKMMGFMVSGLVKFDVKWGKGRICVHYHSEGECHNDYAFQTSHTDMPAVAEAAYGKIIKKTKRVFKDKAMNGDSDSKANVPAASPNKKAKAGEESR